MSGTSSSSKTFTYTNEDVTKVVRRFTADLKMIASSSKSITEQKAALYGEDVEYLAQQGYLEMVDVTLLSAGVEVKAVQYTVKVGAKDLSSSRPGDVLWPVVKDPYLRITLTHTSDYNAQAMEATKSKLNINWTPSDANLSHSTLKESGSRDYSSNAFGVSRKDFT